MAFQNHSECLSTFQKFKGGVMDIQKLTKEQAVIISGFTGILCGEFSDFHADVEKRLGRGVQTFEFGFKEFLAEVKRLYEADFIEMGTVSKEEAKAQAVPEGFVLVNAESLLLHAQSIRMFSNGNEENYYYEIENHVCAIEAMIEAQEPAND